MKYNFFQDILRMSTQLEDVEEQLREKDSALRGNAWTSFLKMCTI